MGLEPDSRMYDSWTPGPLVPLKGSPLWILTYMDPQDPILYIDQGRTQGTVGQDSLGMYSKPEEHCILVAPT